MNSSRLVSLSLRAVGVSRGGPPVRRPAPPRGGPHLMMVCIPRTCGVLLRTLSVWGRGWHWCAEASAALGTQTDWRLEKGCFLPRPHPPTLHTAWGTDVVGAAATLRLACRTPPPPPGAPAPTKGKAKVKGHVKGRAADD